MSDWERNYEIQRENDAVRPDDQPEQASEDWVDKVLEAQKPFEPPTFGAAIDQPEHAPDGVRHIDASNYTGWVQQCLCGEQFHDKAELEQHITEAEQEQRDKLKEQRRQVERALFRNGGLRNFCTARRGL